MIISDILQKNTVISNLNAKTKEDVIKELAELACATDKLKDKKKTLISTLLKRESLTSTGIGDNIAIPHSKMSGIDNINAVFGRNKKGIEFNSIDGKPVFFFFLIIAPENSAGSYLQILARISKLLKINSLRKNLLKAEGDNELYNLLIDEDSKL